MSTLFPTSLRRDPEDPRGLLEQIEAQLKERLEEAIDFFCLDLLVKLRQAHNRPLPEKESEEDRREFKQLVEEFLVFLREGFLARLGEEEVAFQVHLARTLPDYWQAFDELTARFTRERLAAPPPKPGLLHRLLGR